MSVRRIVRLLVWCVAVVSVPGFSADATVSKRVPWSTSRVEGSPEPPKPFVARRLHPDLHFKEPLEIVSEPGARRWIVLERAGRIFSCAQEGEVSRAELVGDRKALHPELDNLYGFAFHPRFAENRRVFIAYTRGAGLEDGTRLSRFILRDPAGSAAGEGRSAPVLDPGSEEVLLTWRSGGHNGANLQFGPDGMLYVSTGDAEVPSPPDPLNTGQDITDLLSSILRIDVDRVDPGRAYGIPGDNPFAAGGAGVPAGARGEVWAYGLRNPWKMSFDRGTGRLWCGDVGWELWEMVHLIERGGNYGWSAVEAGQPVRADAPRAPTPIRAPVVAHSHDEAASITGGWVYHGSRHPELRGAYVYGDWVTGKIWALWHDGTRVTRHEEIAETRHKIIAFGQDSDGELVWLDYATQGGIHELARNPAGKSGAFPLKLSETGLFRGEVRDQAPVEGVYEVRVNERMWHDGASGRTWLGLPGAEGIRTKVDLRRDKNGGTRSSYTLEWPKGSVVAKTLYPGAGGPGGGKALPVETQLLHFDGASWNAYSYRWLDDLSDARLVPATGEVRRLEEGRGSRREWRFHSRSECMRCHNPWSGSVLSIHPAFLKGMAERGDRGDQLDALLGLGLVDRAFVEQSDVVPASRRADAAAGIDDRARAYLHVNCSHCHRRNAGGAVNMLLPAELPLGETMTVGVPPQQGGLGLAQPKLIDPGRPWNSVLCVRLAKSGSGHMPAIGPREVDVAGLRLIEDWIAGMDAAGAPGAAPPPARWGGQLPRGKLATVEGAMQVRRAMDDGTLPEPARREALELARVSPQATVRDLFDRFLPEHQRAERLGPSPDPGRILALAGDAERGAQLLAPQGKLGACLACHFVRGTGRDFGPDLSRVGARLRPEQILESLLHPSKAIANGYATVSLELKDGTAHAGFAVRETGEELWMKTVTGATIRVARREIARRNSPPASLMPEGLLQELSAQEAADVLGFLGSLR